MTYVDHGHNLSPTSPRLFSTANLKNLNNIIYINISNYFYSYPNEMRTFKIEPCLMAHEPSCKAGMVSFHLPKSNFSNLYSYNFQSSKID